jgi:acyl-ACP thioesterase
MDFRNDAGKVIVSARSTWAMLDKETLRLTRVSGEIAERLRHWAAGEVKVPPAGEGAGALCNPVMGWC